MIRRMKRPPWIAIVLGLSVWGGLIALAVNDVWWPLWIGGVATGVALLGGAIAMLWARRMVRGAVPTVKAEAPSPNRTEPIAEPPKPTGRPGSRTNARTAGRRHKGAATALAIGPQQRRWSARTKRLAGTPPKQDAMSPSRELAS